jgi:hypothetical protein
MGDFKFVIWDIVYRFGGTGSFKDRKWWKISSIWWEKIKLLNFDFLFCIQLKENKWSFRSPIKSLQILEKSNQYYGTQRRAGGHLSLSTNHNTGPYFIPSSFWI